MPNELRILKVIVIGAPPGKQLYPQIPNPENMEQASTFLQTKRYAVVTGGNKGIGFEICKQLASKGIVVILTARDEKRGLEAVEKLKESGLSDYVIFHQLDVSDPASVASIADFIKSQFGKLDILVNNAAVLGLKADSDEFGRAFEDVGDWPGEKLKEFTLQNLEMAEECLNINYYAVKNMVEAHFSLLQLSDSPRIINVSSLAGLLENIPNEQVRAVLNDVENLTEEKMDQIINKFKKDFKEGWLEKEGWRPYLSAYTISKVVLNSYTRLMARKYPNILINSVHPGYVKTDMTCNTGLCNVIEGAQPVVRLALLPSNGPSGLFYNEKEVASF